MFKPLVLSEMRRMIVRSNSDDSPPSVASVRRDLFGPIDHDEAQSFVDRELAAMSKRDNEKWGFDFENETPIANSKLCWERVTPESLFATWLGQRDSKSTTDSASDASTTFGQQQSTQKTNSVVKQSHITGRRTFILRAMFEIIR